MSIVNLFLVCSRLHLAGSTAADVLQAPVFFRILFHKFISPQFLNQPVKSSLYKLNKIYGRNVIGGTPGGYPEGGNARGGISHEQASSPEYIDGREHWGRLPGAT